MKAEKEKGIIKKHIGFVVEEVQANIPTDVDNIIFDDDVKKLNYVKLNAILWGCVQEVLKENDEMKNKIEHLESSVYELQEAMKELMKTKPKPKARTTKATE